MPNDTAPGSSRQPFQTLAALTTLYCTRTLSVSLTRSLYIGLYIGVIIGLYVGPVSVCVCLSLSRVLSLSLSLCLSLLSLSLFFYIGLYLPVSLSLSVSLSMSLTPVLSRCKKNKKKLELRWNGPASVPWRCSRGCSSKMGTVATLMIFKCF